MSAKLSDTEIRHRLSRLRNYERLYPQLKAKYEERGRQIKALKTKVREQQATIEQLLLRVEQLEKIIFGSREDRARRRREQREEEDDARQKQSRSKASYRRRTPKEEDVTKTTDFTLDHCPDCHGPLLDRETLVRYIASPLSRHSTDGTFAHCLTSGGIEGGWTEPAPPARERQTAPWGFVSHSPKTTAEKHKHSWGTCPQSA